MQVYNIPAFEGSDDFLRLVAAQRGKLKKGGVPNAPEAARQVLKDWRDGVIPYYTLPPRRHFDELPYEGAEVVENFAKEFDADDVYRHEERAVIGSLPTKKERPDGSIMAEMPAGKQPHGDIESLERWQAAEDVVASTSLGNAISKENRESTKQGHEKSVANKQNKLLYSQPGQYNPKVARAERRRKKMTEDGAEMDVDNDDAESDDFDWEGLKETAAHFKAVDDDEVEDESDDEEGESDSD